MVLSFFSLIVSNVAHLFMYLLAICILSLERCLFRPLPIFNLEFFFFYYCFVWVISVFWILTPFRYMICKYVLPFYRLPFTLLIISFAMQKLLVLSNLTHIFFFYALLCPYQKKKKKGCQNQCQGDFTLSFLLRILRFICLSF